MARQQTPWRRDPAIIARMHDVERRHFNGEPNTHIAAVLGVDEGTIRNDLKRLAELWAERIAADAPILRGQVVARLEDTIRRALAAAQFDEAAERAVLYGETATGEPARIRTDDKGRAEFRGQKAQNINTIRQATMDIAKVLGLLVDKQEQVGDIPLRLYHRGVIDGRGYDDSESEDGPGGDQA